MIWTRYNTRSGKDYGKAQCMHTGLPSIILTHLAVTNEQLV